MTHSYKKSEMLISNIREILKQRKVPMDTQYEIAVFLKKCPESKLTRMSTMSEVIKLIDRRGKRATCYYFYYFYCFYCFYCC
jgi:hypothetical protein